MKASSIRTSFLAAAIALLVPASALGDVSILAYHHVSDDTPPSTSTTPDLFRDQLEVIEGLDMEVVRLSEKTTRAALDGHEDKRLRVALTFDDAYESVYTKAWPILKERGIPFTIFVMTDAIDDGINGYMNWDQLRELADHELVTIGNHTSDHASLLRREGESVKRQTERVAAALDDAAERLEEELGIEPQLFAHPYGEFSEKVDQLLAERGWYGFAQHSGVLGPASNPYAIPRFPVANAFGGIDTLKDKLRARNFPVPYKKLPSPVIGKTNPPALEMPLPEDWRASSLNCFASGQGRMDVQALEPNGGTVARVQPEAALEGRRSRYNCTYPATEGRFYWLSQPWFNRDAPEG
ncbi:polysaccharide deacetylase [Halospina denitrificans]|uniref:Polysaccharide deacetylase n=1 Tax=Halospina denitrificans TaxID=332522 RepID=A0A4R7JMU7_9GAMM|nr:polysaccharide deacetylase family protein [Halospina denitrificans]TDT39390.1 polysaccharide deacetylase [Halospina denitrificans]